MKEYVNNPGREFSRRDFLKAAGIAATAVYAVPTSFAFGQDSQNGDWLLGTWEGEHKAPRAIPGYKDKTEYQFFQDGNKIKWKGTRDVESDVGGKQHLIITGKSAEVSESAVKLRGEYSMGTTILQYVGKPLDYTLSVNVSRDVLEGTALGADNTQFPVSLKKIKKTSPVAGKTDK